MKYPVIETASAFLRRPDAREQDVALRTFGRGAAMATAPLRGPQAWRQLALFLGHWELHGHGLFAVVPQGTEAAVGLVGPWQPAGWPEPEIGWLIWAPGAEALALEAARAARGFAGMRLGWTDAVSYVAEGDAASAALATALGAVADPFAAAAEGAACAVFRHPPARSGLGRAA
jgi:RimJ/RimL family protein N-acetyltransferase